MKSNDSSGYEPLGPTGIEEPNLTEQISNRSLGAPVLQKLCEFAKNNPDIVVLWLYGSRAKGTDHEASDYDLAVAFETFIKDNPIEKRLRPECLAIDWQHELGLPDFGLSVVDINQAPIPLAWEIIQADTVLHCKNPDRLWRETLRIHSRMELDYA